MLLRSSARLVTVPGIDSKKSPKSSNAKSENNDRRCRAFGEAERIDSIAETMISRFSTARAARRFRKDQSFHQAIVVASAPPVGAVVVSSDSDESAASLKRVMTFSLARVLMIALWSVKQFW